jgi:hypothetical protein
MFMSGGKSILVPQFHTRLLAGLIKKRSTTISGVPLPLHALIRNETFQNVDSVACK